MFSLNIYPLHNLLVGYQENLVMNMSSKHQFDQNRKYRSMYGAYILPDIQFFLLHRSVGQQSLLIKPHIMANAK